MTRKDYNLIAATIQRLILDTSVTREQRKEIAAHFARCLRSTNPRFDVQRFIAAAMGEEA